MRRSLVPNHLKEPPRPTSATQAYGRAMPDRIAANVYVAIGLVAVAAIWLAGGLSWVAAAGLAVAALLAGALVGRAIRRKPAQRPESFRSDWRRGGAPPADAPGLEPVRVSEPTARRRQPTAAGHSG